MSARPSGLIVVKRASMYNDDCLPDASVNDPRRADRAASNEINARLSCCDMRVEAGGEGYAASVREQLSGTRTESEYV
jgi:hypothetical protein